MASTLSVTSPADFHVHLRQGSMAALVTPHVRKGGFNLAYVMVGRFRSSQAHSDILLAKPEATDQDNRPSTGIQS